MNQKALQEHLQAAYDVIENSPEQSAVVGVLTALVQLYQRWQKPDDAAYYQELLDDAQER